MPNNNSNNELHPITDLFVLYKRYKSVTNYDNSDYDRSDLLRISAGDIILLEPCPPNVTPLRSFFYGLNERTGCRGLFPVCCLNARLSFTNISSAGPSHLRSQSTDRSLNLFTSHPLSRPVSSNSLSVDYYSQPPALPPRARQFRNLPLNQTFTTPNVNKLLLRGLSEVMLKLTDPVESVITSKHNFINVSISFPILCTLCNDYVISPRCIALQCSNCHCLFHMVCGKLSLKGGLVICRPVQISDELHDSKLKSDQTLISRETAISTMEQPLIHWDCYQIAQWLAVVGLGRFVTLFLRRELDGQFLTQLKPNSPHLQNIADPFARQALRHAILVLKGDQPGVGEDVSILDRLDCNNMNNDQHMHNFRITSFLREVACALCKLPLLGFTHQGFQCTKCGIISHRVCKALNCFTDCTNRVPDFDSSATTATMVNVHDNALSEVVDSHLPYHVTPYASEYFGKALENQVLDEDTRVPLFLIVCTQQIERLAKESIQASIHNSAIKPIDMVEIYQQSAMTSTLKELRKTFAYKLPVDNSEQSSVSQSLDIVQLAQLMKAFLRELPDSVIPEQCYRGFCRLGQTHTSESSSLVSEFLTSLPNSHRLCLIHVFRHLTNICDYQLELQAHLCVKNFPTDKSIKDSNKLDAQYFLINNANSMCAQSGRANNTNDEVVNWLILFRQILIRPPWHSITDLANCLEIHTHALRAIYRVTCKPTSTDMPFINDAKYLGRRSTDEDLANSSTHSDAPTINTPPNIQSTLENKKDIEKQDWYWGDITQAAVRDVMADFSDGYFLVRDASERSMGAFTIVVRWQGENKLNRIYHRGNYFDVVDPPAPKFRLVSELINYYTSHSHPFNIDSGLRLVLPFSRRVGHLHRSHLDDSYERRSFTLLKNDFKQHTSLDSSILTNVKTISEESCTTPLSKSELVNAIQRISRNLNQCDMRLMELDTKSNNLAEYRENAVKQMKGNQKLLKWFQIQLEKLSDHLRNQTDTQLTLKMEQIKTKLQDIKEQIDFNKQIQTNCSTETHSILEAQVRTVNEKRKLRRQLQEIRLALKDQGVGEEVILGQNSSVDTDTNFVPHSQINAGFGDVDGPTQCVEKRDSDNYSDQIRFSNSSQSSSFNMENVCQQLDDTSLKSEINDRRTWFLTSANRAQVEKLLVDKPPGTFVIRPSNTEGKLALGVRLKYSTQHCLIHELDRKYGFIEKACIFDSLEALVNYYHENNLRKYNSLLDITLKYPIFSSLIN